MSSTLTLPGDFLISLGNRRMTIGTGNLGAYVNTGGNHGVVVTPAQLGLGRVDDVLIDPAGGYVFEYVASTGRIKAYIEGSGGGVPNVVVTGGQAAGPGLQITPDSNAGVLGKTTATTRTIPGATFGLVATGGAGSFTEVTDGVNLAGITFKFRAIGY